MTAPAHELHGLRGVIMATAGLLEPVLTITVRGKPAPQGSKTALRGPGGRVNLVESSKGVAGWREAVRAETQDACAAPIDGPVSVTLTFCMQRPRSHYRTGCNSHLLKDNAPGWPCSPARDDIDKLSRAVLDGLTMGGAWHGDGQVVSLLATKSYGLPGVIITVRALARADAHANQQNQTSSEGKN